MTLFSAGGVPWPPNPNDYYVPSVQTRPFMQGDIFEDVPFVKARRGNKITDPPNVVVEWRTVALLGYTCDIYVDGRLAKVQTVAPVIDASRAGIPPDWDGAFTVAPLPDLRGDGRMWAIDLRVAANIDAYYLGRVKRVRCLSELGWAVLRQRLGLASGRVLAHLDDFVAAGRDVWAEMTLWQQWVELGHPEADFQPWLDTRDTNLGGFTRRAALYRGMVDAVRVSVESH